ncbi:MAG: hypothetical protein HY216_07760 [Candidatus Rokubacteria bacterium]|nr:hypothetical protein [Candidatus Rokubacteria bacterium]
MNPLDALDRAWLRRELRGVPDASPITAVDEAELLAGLIAADPLAERETGWREALRQVIAGWPGRIAVSAAACALVTVGFLGGQLVVRDGAPGVGVIPPRPIYEPDDGSSLPNLPAAATVKPESEAKLKQAMAAYGAPDFPVRAAPLLVQAVAADPSNDRAQFWLGVARLLANRPREAVGPLETAAGIAPRNARYRQYLLFAYIASGMNDKATRLDAELMRAR